MPRAPLLIERGATAVVAASDLLALGTILGAREHGLAVPAEWSAVGFDDTALMAYTDPPLTTVRQPIAAMCDHATRLLLDQLGGSRPVNREYLFRPELVVPRLHGPGSPLCSGRDAVSSTRSGNQALVERANLRVARKAKTIVMPTAQARAIQASLPGS